MTLEEITVISIALNDYFGIKFDERKLEKWHKILQDLDFKVCAAAVRRLAETHEGNVYIATIRRACGEITNPPIDAAGFLRDIARADLSSRDGISALERKNPAAYEFVKHYGSYDVRRMDTDTLRISVNTYLKNREAIRRRNDETDFTRNYISDLAKEASLSGFKEPEGIEMSDGGFDEGD